LEEFDRFVEGFRGSEVRQSEPRTLPPAPASTVPSVHPAPPDALTKTEPRGQPHRPRFDVRTIGALAIVAAIGAGLLLSRSRKPAAAVPPSTSSATGTLAPRSPQPSPESAPLVSHSAVNVDLRVVRPVWMRVTVDGQKTREGVAAAGEELRFSGERAIIVRVRNGGDVLINAGSQQEPFGRSGQPVTRTFTPDQGRGSAER
jgi:hypothetical protein